MPDNNALARHLAIGFIAGAVSVATFQQAALFVVSAIHMINASPFSMRPVPPFGVPALLSGMFWGGLWGIVFAFAADRAPRSLPLWAFGLVFGAIAPVLVLWFVVLPLKGQPVAAGFVPLRMLAHILVHAVFGLGLALIFGFLRERIAGERPALRL